MSRKVTASVNCLLYTVVFIGVQSIQVPVRIFCSYNYLYNHIHIFI